MSKLIECTLCKYRTYKQFNMNRHCSSARHRSLIFKTIEEPKKEEIKEQEIIINDDKSDTETENIESSIINLESNSYEQKPKHVIIKEPLFYMLDEISDEESSTSEEINDNKFELPNINPTCLPEQQHLATTKGGYVKNIEQTKLPNINPINTNTNTKLFKLGATMITGGLILPMM